MMALLQLLVGSQVDYSPNQAGLEACVRARLEQEADLVEKQVVVSVSLVNEAIMSELNLTYHQTQGPTDVLSFPFMDEASLPKEAAGFVTADNAGIMLGEIVVCLEVAKAYAQQEKKSVDEVIEFYVLHGLEHLLGNHHE
jgi:probable rRNA maturation factor